ncbi:MAG: ATP-dependent helicase [Thermoprotei archaeon]|nr:MAG: ATP-dependent helicase [Thermoprotei archaeon]
MRRIEFTIEQWLSDEEFHELLRIARYLGRDGARGSRFAIDVDRILRNGLDIEDVVEILDRYGVELGQGELRYLEKVLERNRLRVVVKRYGNEYLLEPQGYLGKLIDDLKHALSYDRSRRAFIVKPMYLFEVMETLERRGVEVINETGIEPRAELPIKPHFLGQLRDYQREALQAWASNKYRGVIALPTGSGKTIIAIAALTMLGVRTLIVAFTKEQMFQWVDQIAKFTDIPRTSIGLFYSGDKRIAPVTVTTYQSAYRYIDKLSPYFSFLVIDEVHHLPADKFRYIAMNAVAPMRMGLSATVVREDGRHRELFPLMGGVVYSKSPKELTEMGYLAPFRIVTVKVRLTPEEERKYRELVAAYRSLVGYAPFEDVLAAARRGVEEAVKAVRIHNEIRQLVHNSRSKYEAVKSIVEREVARGSKIIVFTQYLDQAYKLGEYLGAVVVTGELDEETRRRRLEQFREGLTRVLVVTTVGDEGLDIPDANVGIIVAGTGSRRQFIQRLGRLLRPAPGKEARLYEVVVKNTFEEAEARRRKQLLKAVFEDGYIDPTAS